MWVGKMLPSIYMLTGHAHSGKDTAANYLVTKFTQRGISCIKVSLADHLKVICQKLIRLFYGIEVDLGAFYDTDLKEQIYPTYPEFNGRPFKLRTIMQNIGTEIFRDLMWNQIWCDVLYNKYIVPNVYSVIIIGDCRFPDELKYFEKLLDQHAIEKLLIARITRNTRDRLESFNEAHQSEQHETILVHHEINNDGDLETLYRTLDGIFMV